MRTSHAGSHADYLAWLEAITYTHRREVRVRVLGLDHERHGVVGDILDGQVTIDVSRDVTRVTNLTILDPSKSIGFEPNSAAGMPTYRSRMVQILDRRAVDYLGWVDCPVFTGPVVDLDRNGAQVSLVAEGKERLALGNFGYNHSWAKGRKVTAVIRELLFIAGEDAARIHLPDLSATLPEKLNVTRAHRPWLVAKRLAREVNRVLFYDGAGHVQMRRQPKSPGLTIDRNSLLSPVRPNREPVDLRNRWIVLGPKPKGNKRRVGADIALPRGHEMSAQSLSRNGKPHWLIHEEANGQLKTSKRAREIALDRRDEQMRSAAEVTFDCLPFPHVEEHDLIRVVEPTFGGGIVRARQVTFPLVDGPMTVGQIKRVSIVK